MQGLPGEPEDAQARYLEATVMGLRVASIYLPNGNPVATDKFPYKLRWLERLRLHAAHLLEGDEPLENLPRLALMDVGIHILDLARFYLGEVERISCRTQRINPRGLSEAAY